MKITKILLLIFIFSGLELACSVAHADIQLNTVTSAGWDKLTTEQQAEIIKSITTKVSTNTTDTQIVPNIKPAQINEWVMLGENLGKALGGAAKELGVQANEFAKTPLGLISVLLIVWHFMGGVVMHLVGGVILLLATTLFIKWHKQQVQDIVIEYDSEKRNWFGNSTIKRTSQKLDDDWKSVYMWVWCISALLSLIVMFTY
jgi:hypothetical protein